MSRNSLFSWLLTTLFSVAVLTFVGCGPPPPPADGILAIEGVSKWYVLYRAEHKGKPPKNEEAFFKFVKAKLAERGETIDAEELLTSPRDGKRYEIQYGEPISPNAELNCAVREAEGYDGKKLVAFEGGYAQELDEEQLKKALAGEALAETF